MMLIALRESNSGRYAIDDGRCLRCGWPKMDSEINSDGNREKFGTK